MLSEFINNFNIIFFYKSIYIEELKLLAIADTHITYTYYDNEFISNQHLKELINELNLIKKQLNQKNKTINKIIILGDIKESFGYQKNLKIMLGKFEMFLKTRFKEIIYILGNHDSGLEGKLFHKEYYNNESILFLHGHAKIDKNELKETKLIIQGHQHPAIKIKLGTKTEIYKCYLINEFNNKKIVTLPSFTERSIGSVIDETSYISPYLRNSKLNNIIVVEKDKTIKLDSNNIIL